MPEHGSSIAVGIGLTTPYRLKVTAEYIHNDSEDIQVTMSLARTGLVRRGLLRQTFIITPNNTFRV